MRFLLAMVFTIFLAGETVAQELNCQITILTPTIQTSDRIIYDKMETDLRELLNNRKWTNDEFLNQERIDCNMIITISERVNDDFKGDIQIQSRRPIYHSSYNTTMFNYQDRNFVFRYVQDQLLDFDEANVTSNLTAVVAFYAYIIIGLDYDSFSPEGGTAYYAKAQTIVNNAQNLPGSGWKAFEDTKNRFWLVENLLNVQFKSLRSFIYTYHRQGLDRFADNLAEARGDITNALPLLRRVYQDKPNSFLMQLFFDSKVDELVNIYSQATNDEKNRAVQVFTLVDPAKSLKYQGILTQQK